MYALQDNVLSIVFSLDTAFYLTGGTALHRFYYHLRYSDDLDFFSDDTPLFGENIMEIIHTLVEAGMHIQKTVQTRDFHRVIINDVLQVDFVRDRVYRFGKSNLIGNYRIDNILNILANKLTAILDRDEEKDLFDLVAIAKHEEFSWPEILSIAEKKSLFEKSYLIQRIEEFPLDWLSRIRLAREFSITKPMLVTLILDIRAGRNNSLVGL